ncbi:uncharacterized protein K460DRAFT_407258 [Cucurbitaria berberidis CBS 394.84]|uniref:Uncharacterized protein n=1 Tax=Cucurbitaria berberidis CBS 394.84 TaxID=1168544 RepID=A0A9P4GCG9_9PLEO|nr:uncharacterized protein K460DRAFT_407258 [Cucurbitaria berberidis CBS 394.84]KAF1842877.1 hypothetical protein K460DRAFT_407258 [Cucurbitaria berberidis CBS 394.84]
MPTSQSPPPPFRVWKVIFPLPNERDEDHVDWIGWTTSELLFKVCGTFRRWQPIEPPDVFDDWADFHAKKKQLFLELDPETRTKLNQPYSSQFHTRELSSWWVNHKTKKVDRKLEDPESDVQLGLYCAILHTSKKLVRDFVNQGELEHITNPVAAEQHERELDEALKNNEELKKLGVYGVGVVDINNFLRGKPTRDKVQDVKVGAVKDRANPTP